MIAIRMSDQKPTTKVLRNTDGKYDKTLLKKRRTPEPSDTSEVYEVEPLE